MTDEDHWGLLASALSSFDRTEDDEDEVSLDVREEVLTPADLVQDERLAKTPVHRGKRYLRMKAAVTGLVDGRLSKVAFLNTIRPLLAVQDQAVQAMDSPEIHDRFVRLPAEEYKLFKEVQRCLSEVGDGLREMLAYQESDGFDEVLAAMQHIDEVYIQLHHVQDQIVEVGRRNLS